MQLKILLKVDRLKSYHLYFIIFCNFFFNLNLLLRCKEMCIKMRKLKIGSLLMIISRIKKYISFKKFNILEQK